MPQQKPKISLRQKAKMWCDNNPKKCKAFALSAILATAVGGSFADQRLIRTSRNYRTGRNIITDTMADYYERKAYDEYVNSSAGRASSWRRQRV